MTLRFSRGWCIIHTLLFGALTWLSCWLAFIDEPHEADGRRAWLAHLNLASGGWLFFVGFGLLALWSARWLFRSIWRVFSRESAVAVTSEGLVFHRSFAVEPLSLGDVEGTVVDRADRLPPTAVDAIAHTVAYAASRSSLWGAGVGLKLRWGLRIYYRANRGKGKYITIGDNVVRGGKRALIEFEEHLAQLREARRAKTGAQ
ncbi:hypothetical protein [uncultured Sphingopyxis sp.]|jgi:hypothetical protein|uniref:hypothetical protein n=1 Tax=uncultured Sphingopyxis sp. TaxID=310581 RepID=UPI000B15E4D0|nr:hypothetical protein [uncultured Sphingopyxis sp.]